MTELTEEQATKVLQESQRKKLERIEQKLRKLQNEEGFDIVGIPIFTNDGRVDVIIQARIR
jgi:hypothetical protein